MYYTVQFLYPPSNPLPVSSCPNAHQPANRESFLPPSPLDFPWAAMAESRSKKSKMILVRASESILMGMNVANESRAILESMQDS